ncbi:MAG: bifunctional phosphoribosylaminoimidazolecarboxamide formyltransferase/IMP cyclohydrolase [Peptococcaceae bacterium]|nr:bifunctional phosphoribosylaminoimidazolecarboxamide formyltransferase/IMP cyclohydrolase [Peptococcaceae bacterium]
MKRALISVSDKTGLQDFAKALVELDYEILSTGGTARALHEAGVPVIEVSDVTKFPEILDGRVKTLHPIIHAGILARGTEAHMQTLKDMDIAPIDLVVINLYPFEETIAKPDVDQQTAIENIDIGGPTMVRAAAKNHERVSIVVDPSQYDDVIKALKSEESITLAQRQQLAMRAFEMTARYDAAISQYMVSQFAGSVFEPSYSFGGRLQQMLRYGENPHQKAAFYAETKRPGTLAGAEQLGGKELSYNNIVDTDAAWQMVNEFVDQPACAIIKHTNPCGFATGKDVCDAFVRAHEADPLSSYGGIVAFNREVDVATAEEIIKTFFEAVIAPGYEEGAVDILHKKEKLRILDTKACGQATTPWIETISGGFLVQERDTNHLDVNSLKVVTEKAPDASLIEDLVFAWNVVKHVKSNAIVVAKDGVSIGVGAGQMNRVGSCDIALTHAGDKAKGAVLASDAFFPFADNIEVAAKAGIAAIIQPGGSIRDQEVIDACNKYGIAMVFTGVRHFKH